jgi:hypothetical protein
VGSSFGTSCVVGTGEGLSTAAGLGTRPLYSRGAGDRAGFDDFDIEVEDAKRTEFNERTPPIAERIADAIGARKDRIVGERSGLWEKKEKTNCRASSNKRRFEDSVRRDSATGARVYAQPWHLETSVSFFTVALPHRAS